METQKLLPKRLTDYIHEMGVRALDHLAENYRPAEATDGAAPTAVKTLIDHWKAMPTEEKEAFVEEVATSVVSVVAASAVLPLGLKLGKKAVKATKKVFKRETKKARENDKKKQKST